MALIKQSIDNLLGGVSQAPPWQRAAGQMEELVNVLLSPARGLVKRPPLDHVASVVASTGFTGAEIHRINRGSDEKFTMVFPGDGTVSVFNTDTGAAQTVSYSNSAGAYLNGSSPMRATSVGDVTYVVNPDTTVATTAASNERAASKLGAEALIWVKSDVLDEQYAVELNGTTTTATTTSGEGNTVSKAMTLASFLAVDHPSLSFTQIGSMIIVVDPSGSDLTISVESPDGWMSMALIHDYVTSESDLPTAYEVPPAFCVGVQGDPSTDVDDYFLEFDGSAWQEIPKPGESSALDQTTMPVKITYTGSVFVVDYVEWEERPAGDDTTNPDPSFVGETLDEVLFHEGRFGVVLGNQIVLSRSGEPTSFYRETVRSYRTNAPVDIEAPYAARFHSALSWNERLYLFSSEGQYLLGGDPIISPRSVWIRKLSSYESDDGQRPTISGSHVYLAREMGGGTQIVAWTHGERAPAFASDLMEVVPSYVDGSPVSVAVDEDTGFLAVATSTATYTATFRLDPRGGLAASAWSKWTFPSGSTVVDMEMNDGVLSVLLEYSGALRFATMSIRKAMGEEVAITNDFSSITGEPYDSTVNFTPIYLRDQNGAAVTSGRLTVQYLDLMFGSDSNVSVTVTPPNRSARVTAHDEAGESTLHLPVRAKGPDTTLSLSCTGTADFALTRMVWKGTYNDSHPSALR